MKNTVILLFAGLLLSFISCSQSEPEVPAGEMAEGSRTESGTVVYDARFPFPVWTDEHGEMHFEINLDDYDIPSRSALSASVVGKGWRLDKCYTYIVSEAFPPYYEKTVTFSESDCFEGIDGGDLNPKYFICSASEFTVYYRWWDNPGTMSDREPDMHYAIDSSSYGYDEHTGVLDMHYLKWFKVVKCTPDELWLGSAQDKDRTFLRMVAAAPEEVEQWNAEYGG